MFGFTKPDALVLKQVAQERRHGPRTPPKEGLRPGSLISLTDYLVILDGPLPAAYFDEEAKTWTLGEQLGVIWRREHDDDGLSQDPENETNPILIPQRTEENTCVRVRVFNPLAEEIDSCHLVACTQDAFGDLYVHADAGPAGAAGTSTSTTTTMPPCTTRCKWVWVSASNVWVNTLDCNGTGTTTTTTTTTTTSSSTTTTTTTTTTSSSTTSTTTTTSSTTSTTTTTTTSSTTSTSTTMPP